MIYRPCCKISSRREIDILVHGKRRKAKKNQLCNAKCTEYCLGWLPKRECELIKIAFLDTFVPESGKLGQKRGCTASTGSSELKIPLVSLQMTLKRLCSSMPSPLLFLQAKEDAEWQWKGQRVDFGVPALQAVPRRWLHPIYPPANFTQDPHHKMKKMIIRVWLTQLPRSVFAVLNSTLGVLGVCLRLCRVLQKYKMAEILKIKS